MRCIARTCRVGIDGVSLQRSEMFIVCADAKKLRSFRGETGSMRDGEELKPRLVSYKINISHLRREGNEQRD